MAGVSDCKARDRNRNTAAVAVPMKKKQPDHEAGHIGVQSRASGRLAGQNQNGRCAEHDGVGGPDAESFDEVRAQDEITRHHQRKEKDEGITKSQAGSREGEAPRDGEQTAGPGEEQAGNHRDISPISFAADTDERGERREQTVDDRKVSDAGIGQPPGADRIATGAEHAQQSQLHHVTGRHGPQAAEVDPGGDSCKKQESDHDANGCQFEEIHGACWSVYLIAGVMELTSMMTPVRQSIGTHRSMRRASGLAAGRSDPGAIATVPSWSR